jgi:tripartite-type tricarboxylate transporter receptor subunit TctC
MTFMHPRGRARRALLQAAAAGAALEFAPFARAQSDWPRQPVRLIVPYAPGGANDTVLRLVSRHVGDRLGQPIVIDNRPGAGGLIGTSALAQARPDGYTFGVGATSTLIATPLTNPQSPPEPASGLVFVALLAAAPMLLVAHPSVPVASAAELPAYLKLQRGKLGYGSMAVGHFGHVVIKELSDASQADMTHAPYKGEAPLLQDLASGQIQIALATPPAARGLIETGRIRALGVTGSRRLRLFPGVPTLAEQGYAAPLYRMTAGWIGIMGPAGVPDAIVQRLGAEYVGAIQTPEVRDRLLELGLEPIGADAPTFAATYARERPIWRDLLVRAGVEVRAP